MQKKNKIMASLIAVAMLAMSFAVVWTAADTDASDPSLQQMPTISSANYGEFAITIAYEGVIAGTFIQTGYNAAIAIDKIGLLGLDLDMNYATWQTNAYGDFWGINPYYGEISMPTTINNTYYDRVSIWYYDEAAGSWERGPTSALGFYKPFEDYELNTANIYLNFFEPSLFIIKERAPSIKAFGSVVPLSVIQDPNNDDFKVTFNISANCDLRGMNYPGSPYLDAFIQLLANGFIAPLEGRGSDCYLALVNAASAYGLSGQGNVLDPNQDNNINTSYGSVQDLYGLNYGYELIPNGVRYYYWSLYLGGFPGDNPPGTYADWLLGFMSPLAEAGALDFDDNVQGSWPVSKNFVQNEFWLYYSYS